MGARGRVRQLAICCLALLACLAAYPPALGRADAAERAAAPDPSAGGEPSVRALADRAMTQLYEDGNPLAARDTALQALARAEAVPDRFGRAAALQLLGEVEVQLGDHGAALARHRAARQEFAALGDAEGEAAALLAIGVLELSRGEDAAAKPNLEAARRLFAAAGSPYGQARAESNLGLLAARHGRLQTALAHHRAAHAIYWQLSAAPDLAAGLVAQGDIYRSAGDYDAAKQSYHAAHGYRALAGDAAGEAAARFAAAQMEYLTGSPGQAERQLAAALELFRQTGGGGDAEGEAMLFAARLAFEKGDRAATIAALDRAEALFAAAGDRRGTAAVLEKRGGMQARSDPAAAMRDFARCAELRERLGLEREAKLCRAAAAALEEIPRQQEGSPSARPARR